MHSYGHLQEKGIIYNQRGKGYFIAEDALKKVQNSEKETFFNEQLPQLFKNMQLLNLEIADLEKHYQEFLKSNKPGEPNEDK